MYKTIIHKKILHQKLVGRVARIYLKHDKVQLTPKTANINKNQNPDNMHIFNRCTKSLQRENYQDLKRLNEVSRIAM